MTIRTFLSLEGRPDGPTILLVVLLVATVFGLGVAASTSSAAFDPFNPSWDGSSDLISMIDDGTDSEIELVRETDQYADVEPEDTVSFVIAPTESYDEQSAAAIEEFVDAGGTVVVFDNFEAGGNDLLEGIGAEARVDGRLLRDEENNDRGPLMPIATNVTEHPRTGEADALGLNYASVIEPGNATVLVETSEFAYLVMDPETELGDEEDQELAAAPVVTTEPLGNGAVITVSDPSIATNAMLSESDNTEFVQALYGDADMVVLDHSHTSGFPPLSAVVVELRSSPLVQGALGVLAVVSIVLLSRQRELGIGRHVRRLVPGIERAVEHEPTTTLSDEEWAAVLRTKHPDWDESRVQRVITAFNRTDSKRGDTE